MTRRVTLSDTPPSGRLGDVIADRRAIVWRPLDVTRLATRLPATPPRVAMITLGLYGLNAFMPTVLIPTKIRRIVPYLNHSREAEGWPKLRARLVTYRLVIGLPRQVDLLYALERNGITAEQAADWKIDLRPPPLPG